MAPKQIWRIPKKEEEKTRTYTIDEKIDSILNKKKGIGKEIGIYKNNFYSIECKPIQPIKSLKKK